MKNLVPNKLKEQLHYVRNRYLHGLKFHPGISRLNLGCGDNVLSGWANVDFTGHAGVIAHDLTTPLPLADNSIKFIYTEHFIEHITREQGLAFLSDCYRVLKPKGVLRLSTPNLRRLVEDYLNGPLPEWDEWDWAPKTPCQMINGGMHLWGHKFIYDYPEIRKALAEAGFGIVENMKWGESRYPELKGLETRVFHDDIIIEATKTLANDSRGV